MRGRISGVYPLTYVRSSVNEVLISCVHMGANKSLARPGRKQANVSVRMA